MNRLQRLEYLQELELADGSPHATLRPLKDLMFVNAAGALVRLRKSLEGSRGGLTLLNPGRTVGNILKLVGLSPLVKQEDVTGAPVAAPRRPEPEADIDHDVLGRVDPLLSADAPAPEAPTVGRVELTDTVTYLNAQPLLDALLAQLSNGSKHVRLDVARVTFIDSAGVGTLLKAAKAFSGVGGDLTLVAPGPALQRILKIVKLDRVVRIES